MPAAFTLNAIELGTIVDLLAKAQRDAFDPKHPDHTMQSREWKNLADLHWKAEWQLRKMEVTVTAS